MLRPNLDDIYDQIRADSFWDHLRAPGIRLVGGSGCTNDVQTMAMVIGEAPGAVENTKVLPFCGPSGRMLTQLLDLAGLSRETVFITNTVKYRPPGNRTPTRDEVAHGAQYLKQEYLAIGAPEVIITLGIVGRTAIMLGHSGSTIPLYGHPYPLRSSVWLWPMYHPAFGLRREDMQETIEQHWEALGTWLDKQQKRIT